MMKKISFAGNSRTTWKLSTQDLHQSSKLPQAAAAEAKPMSAAPGVIMQSPIQLLSKGPECYPVYLPLSSTDIRTHVSYTVRSKVISHPSSTSLAQSCLTSKFKWELMYPTRCSHCWQRWKTLIRLDLMMKHVASKFHFGSSQQKKSHL